MTANREKPEQLTFFFFEEMPKPTKGTIYLDTSKKGVTKFKTRRHNSYRAEVTYNGVKYRKRSAERADCEQFLAQLAEKYEKEIFLRHGFHLVYDKDLGEPIADGLYCNEAPAVSSTEFLAFG